MTPHISHIQQKLEKRKSENAFRELKVNNNLVDFCSNDYLGFSCEKEIHLLDKLPQYGSTGSRLISGNHQITEEVEQFLATYYKAESGLIFNAGYNANIGLFSCVAQRTDTIIYDELIHASIRDGIKLSNANSFSFKHSDLIALEDKIINAKGNVFVAVESIYSMDGDEAPLKELTTLCKKYDAALIVDEAHAGGIFGAKGEGLIVNYNLENEVFARVVTFGKAYGCHGAVVLGNKLLRNYLINYARSFIYTTALPLNSILSIKKAHQFLESNLDRIEKLHQLIGYFKFRIQNSEFRIIKSKSPIQCIIVPKNDAVKQLAENIQKNSLDVRAILSPTVPKGQERLRICLHSFNTKKQIDKLITHLCPPSREETSPLEEKLKGVNSSSREESSPFEEKLKGVNSSSRKETSPLEGKLKGVNSSSRKETSSFEEKLKGVNSLSREESSPFEEKLKGVNSSSRKETSSFEGKRTSNITSPFEERNTFSLTSPLEGRYRGVITESNNYYNKNLKPLARKNRKQMTKAEVKIWNDLLRKKQCLGYKFLRQRPILSYIVDFMCVELNLIIEIDGYSHHFEKVYENDVKRQAEIEKLGYTFIRFADEEVLKDFNNVIRTLEIFIAEIEIN